MSIITKKVKCATCGSYIHDTERCYVWQNSSYCSTNEMYKSECNCDKCINKCLYCNIVLNYNNGCRFYHNGDRCLECNEFLRNGKCCWNHTKPFCRFCGLPVDRSNGLCANYHREKDPICLECNMPEYQHCKHSHDGVKCKKCNSLLNYGGCIYNCIDGSNSCIYCNYKIIINNYCMNCLKNNSGQFTKKAIK